MAIDRRGFLIGAAALAASPVLASLGGCGSLGDVEGWVQGHACELDLKTGIPSGALGDIDAYEIFLAGERHGFTKNYSYKKALIQALQRDAGVNCLLLEMGVGAGMMLERYLQTGDEGVLALVMSQMRGTAAGTQEEEEFWRWLLEYNNALKGAERLHVCGLDIDHQTYLALWALSNIVAGGSDAPESAAAYLEALENEMSTHDADESPRELLASRTFEELDIFLSQNEREARIYFGDDFETVRLMADGHRIAVAMYSSEDGGQSYSDDRDAYMVSAFEHAASKVGRRVYFGQLGSAHTVQRLTESHGGLTDCSTFAMRLGEQGADARMICSIQYAYRDLQGQDASGLCDDGWGYFETLDAGDILLDLEASGSPFSERIDIADGVAGEPTTTCFQKLLLVSGFEQATPLS